MSTPDLETVAIGAQAPDFELPDINGEETMRLSALQGQITVIDFWSYECPWSQRYDAYFAERVSGWAGQGILFFAINSNANESDDAVREALDERNLPFTVLRDAGNVVADAYGAVTTPHVFVVDRDGRLVYRGAVDDRAWRQEKANIDYLDAALEALSSGEEPEHPTSEPRGCTIVRHFEA